MPDLDQLHRLAREIFDHALSAVDPRAAVKQAIKLNGAIVEIGEARLDVSSRPIYGIAIGKAATAMAAGLEEALGVRLAERVLVCSGGHPLPDEASLAAARAAFEMLDRANAEEALVVFLISGGGSAMIEWPVSDDISLADLRAANHILVNCGASIAEINAVRRAFSAVKGGALARRAPRAQMFSLIVSDTNRGDEASVASGPTMNTPPDAPQAIEVIERHHLETRLPESVMKSVRTAPRTSQEEGLGPAPPAHVVLLNNGSALEAAHSKALALGFTSVILDDISEQPIETGCDLLLSRLFTEPTTGPFCAISGGEFSCPVRGDGRGGRNLETVLRCAIRLAWVGSVPQRGSVGSNANANPTLPRYGTDPNSMMHTGQHFVILSAGTDGIDGNSPAAGAIVDETTISRARQLGLDPHEYLARSDSYSFFERLNTLIITGPTVTNVRDLRIFLRSS